MKNKIHHRYQWGGGGQNTETHPCKEATSVIGDDFSLTLESTLGTIVSVCKAITQKAESTGRREYMTVQRLHAAELGLGHIQL